MDTGVVVDYCHSWEYEKHQLVDFLGSSWCWASLVKGMLGEPGIFDRAHFGGSARSTFLRIKSGFFKQGLYN